MEIVRSIEKDKWLDSVEYSRIVAMIEQTPESFRQLRDKNQKLAPEKLIAHISKLAKNRELVLSSNAIWSPFRDNVKIKPFSIDVFIENSMSMDGYVGGKSPTEFQNAVYRLLVELNLTGLCSEMNLNYINSRVIAYEHSAGDPQIRDFIQNLDPTSFRARGGKRDASDMRNVIDSVLSRVNEKSMGILVTDAVFSPGKNNEDASAYLENQSIGLKNAFARKLSVQSVSFLLLQLESDFSGSYYDRYDHPHRLKNDKRPYYIMIFGTPVQMNALLNKQIVKTLGTSIGNAALLQHFAQGTSVEYGILRHPRTGSFRPDPYDPAHSIHKAEVSTSEKTKGIFSFTVSVSLDKFHLPDTYLTDSLNYHLSNPAYRLQVEPLQNAVGFANGATYRLRLTTKKPEKESITVSLVARIPDWVRAHTSTDDTRIMIDSKELRKTFGLSYLYEGIFEAYRMKCTDSSASSPGQYPLCSFIVHIKTLYDE